MQISGILKIKDNVVSLDTATADLYNSIQVELKDVTMVMPKPIWLKDDDKEIGVCFQYTSSGTWHMTLMPVRGKQAMTDEEMAQAAETLVRARRTRVETPPDVDRESDEFQDALEEVKKSANAKGSGELDPSGIVAKVKDGELVSK